MSRRAFLYNYLFTLFTFCNEELYLSEGSILAPIIFYTTYVLGINKGMVLDEVFKLPFLRVR